MDLSRPFILRPVATALLMLSVLIAGLLAWRALPVAALPQVDYPVIQVFTFSPGASPDLMARTVTAPLERRLGQIPGLQQMSSTSSAGASVITLKFAFDVGTAVSEQEVQAAINTASSLLPENLPTPPIYRKVNPADAPILTLAISSETLALPQVVDLVETRMAQKLSRLSGIGLVSLAGGQRPAIRIDADSRALSTHGMGLEALREAVSAANVNQPKGSFDGERRSTMLDANDQIRSVAEYRDMIVAWREGAPVRLSDVAAVNDGAEDAYLAAWAGSGTQPTRPAVLLNIQRQPGANVIAVADRVRALLPQLTATLPASVKVQVLTDRTESIRASVRDVQKELLFAIALVVAVTFVFLRTFAATLIPSIAVPLSLVGTFTAMYLLGYSLNNLSLMALTIATGFVVDDAIVMLENIARHREAGETPLAAALKGASEIGFTLISLTVSLLAVLIPLLFMADVVGRLFHEFAVTLAVAIGISLLVSLTLTPMMAAYMLRDPPGHTSDEHGAQGDWMDGVLTRYARMLDWVLARQVWAMAVMGATLALTAVLYLWVPKGFFPVQDSGVIQVVTEAPQSISFAAMAARQQALGDLLLADPVVSSLSSFIGIDGSNATLNSGRMLLNLHAHDARTTAMPEAIERLRARAATLSGITAWFQPVQELGMEDRISRTQYQFTLSSPDSQLLETTTTVLLAELRRMPALADVASNLQPNGLQAHINIDRDAAARFGVRISDIAAALHSAFGQRQISTLFTQASQYRVVLSVDDIDRGGLHALDGIFILPSMAAGLNPGPVPLTALAHVEQRRAPLAIDHQGQFPAVTLSFNVAPGYSLGSAIDAIDRVAHGKTTYASNDTNARLPAVPAAVALTYQGAAEGFRESLSNTLWLILAAVVVMYLVLGMLYESLLHPLTILSTLPSATVGALLALLLADQPLDLIAVIGIVLLIGLVKKNGIMMVDFALDGQRRLGLSPRDAVRRAALLRLRPILMTTLAALFGAVPLLLASGSGAELRQPLGLVMVGGLIVSQILTIFTTPVVYLVFDRLGRRSVPSVAPA